MADGDKLNTGGADVADGNVDAIVQEDADGSNNDENNDESPSLDDLRQMGNYHFSKGDYDQALTLYDLALEMARNEENKEALILNLSNRSACLFKMEEYEEAKKSAHEAVELSNGKNAKASYRLAKTKIMLKEYGEAVEFLETALSPSTKSDATSGQRKALGELLEEAKKKYQPNMKDRIVNLFAPSSIKHVKRDVSIKEFDVLKELGVGNFSDIFSCRHKKTSEEFALKKILKKKAADLAKRQHPNVYNEIQMERRVLIDRLPQHPNIVQMYHTFQDYNTLYYLMELHTTNIDLWTSLRYQNRMIGCHRSLVKVYLKEIIDALEHMHSHGIVHRDLKPENMLLSATGHIIIIDFGTAKDLIETDLNGPEFVGTPDFMSPEAVRGSSGEDEVESEKEKAHNSGAVAGSDHTLDLWALGTVAYILFTGTVPFWSPSPYLAFLKIKRGRLYRPWGIADDYAWDFIHALIQVDPAERLGAGCFEVVMGKDKKSRSIKNNGFEGYDVLRKHPYFTGIKEEEKKTKLGKSQETNDVGQLSFRSLRNVFASGESGGETDQSTPIPSLCDLCVRPIAELVKQDSLDLDLCDAHPPGDGSSHDLLRLDKRDRKCVMHVLDRLGVLNEPRVYRRFFKTVAEARLDKLRVDTRDFVGLTQMSDNQGKFRDTTNDDPYAEPVDVVPIKFVHITSPLFVQEMNESCDDATRKRWIKMLKRSISTINRIRPKLVVASGFINDKCRKLLAKISDSIPVVVHNGSEFSSFWLNGAQGLLLRSNDYFGKVDSSELDEDQIEGIGDLSDRWNRSRNDMGLIIDARKQMAWLGEQLEQSRMSKHHVFVFVDCDPRQLPRSLLKRLARGKALCILGFARGEAFSMKVSYEADDGSDNDSVRSTESDEDASYSHTSTVMGTHDNGLRWITFKESEGEWQSHFTSIELASE